MKFIKQLAIIFSISFIAEVLEYLIPLPIAASIYGLVLMLLGLVTHLIPLEKVEGAADFLVDIMPIMFIPATVGIMNSVDALKKMLIPLTVIIVVTTLLIMLVTGRTAQFLLRRSAGSMDSRAEGVLVTDEVQTQAAGKMQMPGNEVSMQGAEKEAE